MKFASYSNFSAFWRGNGHARIQVLTVRSMRVNIVPAFVFGLEAVTRSCSSAYGT